MIFWIMLSNLIPSCGALLCWKCYRNLRDPIKTTKAEFEDMPEPWWMHAACMNADDKRAYYGETENSGPDEDNRNGRIKDDDDEDDITLAWA